ncbi:MAG: multiheme c-type cytochrome [Phycisphaerales bacterium]
MKRKYTLLPLTLGSAAAIAGWMAFEPEFVESTPEVIKIDPNMGAEPEAPSVVVGESDIEIDPETGFAAAAFPPTIPDREWHQDAWLVNNCLDCHETGVQDAPQIRHKGLPEITWESKCRTCHVLIRGLDTYEPKVEESEFASWAFPPMMPNNDKHAQAWGENNCLMCHEDGIRGAPVVKHDGLPRLTLKSKCRSCHVQIRSYMASPWQEDE